MNIFKKKPRTVDTILSQFNKMISELDAHAKDMRDEADERLREHIELTDMAKAKEADRRAAVQEAARANVVSKKIESLLG